MYRIEYLKATSQVITCVFDFPTCTRHGFITSENHLVEAVGNQKTFERVIVFPFLENILNRNRDVSDLMLDCVPTAEGKFEMEILPGLLEEMRGVDPSTITVGIYGKKKGPGEPVYLDDIGFIVIEGEVGDDKNLFIKDDKIFTSKKTDSGVGRFPEEYSHYGSVTPERKADKKAETKKPDLHIVPERGDRKKKRARKKVSRPDVVKYFSKVNPRSNWHVTFKAMCKDSRYRDLAMDSRTGHKRTKWARIYSNGIDSLANTTGRDEKTVRRHITLMIEQKIIKEVWHGFKGQGYSRHEIPLNMSHVFAWRRKPPK
ncbi:hypothetical protein ES703_38853 [subsurface metagenome]